MESESEKRIREYWAKAYDEKNKNKNGNGSSIYDIDHKLEIAFRFIEDDCL